jgi:hypothetical protein
MHPSGPATPGTSMDAASVPDRRLTLVVLADLSDAAVPAFQAYEAAVLPLLARHGGVLERRLRSGPGTFEAHVISFADEQGYRAYLADPDRIGVRDLLSGCDVRQRVEVVEDIGEQPHGAAQVDAYAAVAAERNRP